MNTQTINPLMQFSKKPARYIKIPSQGQGYSNLKLTDSGEIAVYPMTAKDELMLKSPDALLNGEAVISVLRNCVPDVPNPREIQIIDIDSLMVAVRMATYGDNMDMVATCPHDKHENNVQLNLPSLLDQQTYWTGLTEIETSDKIVVKMKPYTVTDQNKTSLVSFEQMTVLSQLDRQEADTQTKLKTANSTFSQLIDVTLELMTNSIVSATTPDGQEITDKAFIKQWVVGLSKADYDLIDNALKDLIKIGLPKSMNIKCDNCGEIFEAPINFNPSDFFE